MKKYRNPIAAIDFDGTIVEHRFPAIGDPLPDAFNVLKALRKSHSFDLILWTCRDHKYLEQAVDFCGENGVVFDAVNDNVFCTQGKFANRKIYADYYIDDRGLFWMAPPPQKLSRWGWIYSLILGSMNNLNLETDL